MAKVLFLTQVLPYPLDAGPKIRAYYVLRRLAERHEVTLVSFVRPDDRAEHISHLASLCQNLHTVPMRRSRVRDGIALAKALVYGDPVIIVRDEVAEMQRLLQDLVANHDYDIIHADQTSMAQYAQYARAQTPRLSNQAQTRLVLDAHNALYRVFEQMARDEPRLLQRLFLRREARALARYERSTYPRFDRVVWVAEEDRLAVGMHGENASATKTIPICIDPVERPLIPGNSNRRLITHLGTMFWPPNVDGVLWFAREVMPLVLEKVPDARLAIIGKRPPPEVQELATQSDAVEVLGYVVDPEPYLAQTAAFIVPLHAGAGMRVKILDAWCWGVPIVSTTIGAEGMEIKDGENILIADDPASYAEAIVRLMEEPDLLAALRQNGRQWVEERYNWQGVYRQWDQVYEEMAA